MLRSPDGNAPVWRTSHRWPGRDRSTPVRDRTGRGGPCSRDARTGPARRPQAAGRRRSGAAAAARRSADERELRGGPRRGRPAPEAWSSAPSPWPPGWAGCCWCSRCLAGLAAPFPTYLVGGGQELSPATGVGGALVALVARCSTWRSGVVLGGGAVPKFGLAYAGVAGALAVGQLLIELYRGISSTTRPASR